MVLGGNYFLGEYYNFGGLQAASQIPVSGQSF